MACRLSPWLLAWICCDQPVELASGTSPGRRDPPCVGADVDHADAVVRVEDGERVARADLDPVLQSAAVPSKKACSTSGGSAKS